MMQILCSNINTLPAVPAGYCPEGIANTQMNKLFDENTCYLLQALPKQYMAIFLHLIRYATLDARSSMQLSLFSAIGENNHEAIILYKSTSELAKTANSPAGPETYGKAILIFEALQIIRRKFHRGYTEIRISLGKREILIPAMLQSLRQLHTTYCNEKVKQLARKVASILKSGEFLAGIPRPATPPDAELRGILTQLLQDHGIDAQHIHQTSLAQTCAVLSKAMNVLKSGRVSAPAGDFIPQASQPSPKKKGDSLPQVGEFLPQPSQLLPGHTGDSFTILGDSSLVERNLSSAKPEMEETSLGDSHGKESPISAPKVSKRRQFSFRKGDLDTIFGKESPEFDQHSSFLSQKGDSLPHVSISASSLSNNYSLEKDTFIDALLPEKENTPKYVDTRSHAEIVREMEYYANLFDSGASRNWQGSLYKTIKETSPEIRRLAAIGAIYYREFRQADGSYVYAPGGWFTSACKRYRAPGAIIPAELRAWDQSGLALDEIEIQVKKEIRHPSQMVDSSHKSTREVTSSTEFFTGAEPISEEMEEEYDEDDFPPLPERLRKDWNEKYCMVDQQPEEPEEEYDDDDFPPLPEHLRKDWNEKHCGIDQQEAMAFPVPEQYELPKLRRVQEKGRGWMDQEEAEFLRNRVVREGQRFALEAEVHPGERKGTFVVVSYWDGIDVTHRTAAQWDFYFAEVCSCLE